MRNIIPQSIFTLVFSLLFFFTSHANSIGGLEITGDEQLDLAILMAIMSEVQNGEVVPGSDICRASIGEGICRASRGSSSFCR